MPFMHGGKLERRHEVYLRRRKQKKFMCRKDSEVGPSNRIRQDIGEGEEHRNDLQGEMDKTDEQDELEANHDSWSMSGSFIARVYFQERPKLYVPLKISLPIPLK